MRACSTIYGLAVSGRARLEESRDEQLDHVADIVARVVSNNRMEVDMAEKWIVP
jgi:hypothetical protein